MTPGLSARSAAFCLALAFLAAGCAGSKPPSSTAQSPERAPGAGIGPDSLVALADSAIRMAEPDLARRALQRAAELDPQNPRVRLGLGRYYTAILRYKDAKAEFDRAAALEPESPEPPYWLGVAYLKAGDKEEALAALGLALRLDPGHERARATIRPLLEERYRAAGIPQEYASLSERSTISRGELGVMLAVELGVDPDRLPGSPGTSHRTDWPGLDEAWGARWLRAAVARGWIVPLADRNLHLDDPVTRGALALALAEVAAQPGSRAPADSARSAGASATTTRSASTGQFPDLASGHYLGRVAVQATQWGLPVRDGGRFEPQAFATGLETTRVLQGLSRWMGVHPAVSIEPAGATLVK